MKLLQKKLNHALPAFFLAAGLLIPLLGVLDPSFADPALLLRAAAVVVLFEAASLSRVSATVAAGLFLSAVLAWLLGFGGLTVARDIVIALSLRMSGQMAALPLIASEVVWFFSLIVPLLACFAMLERATWIPSLVLTVLVTVLVWLGNRMDLLPWLLPAFAAVLLMLILDRHESLQPLRILPWAAAALALAFLLTPRDGVVYEPLREKADDLRQAVMDRLFFTEPRDVFSLSSEGYYPQGSRQLGGTPDLNDRQVMQVSAPRTVYLRGVILNEYDGRSWSNTTGGRRYLWQSPRLEKDRSLIFDRDLPAETVRNSLCEPLTVSVRMLSANASTLFVPQRVRSLDPGGELVPYFSNASEIFVTRNLQAGDTWSVSAPLFLAGDSGIGRLIDASASFEDPQYEKILETYTRLPSHLEQPVYDLAAEAASAGTTPYERALAIQTWLSRNFRYTLEVEDQPANVDFVTRFLLTTKEGYCTYFASAMTVLCRMEGLPARYVEGYLAEPDATGNALVTGRSAHAWTEVYFRGFGWLTFDATPHTSRGESGNNPSPSPEPTEEPTPVPSPEPEEESPEPEDEPTPPPEDEPSPEPSAEPETPSPEPDSPTPSPEPPATTPEPDAQAGPRGSSFPWLWLLPLLLLLALALRLRFTAPGFRERKARSEDVRFEIWARELSELLRAENWKRRAGETPMAFTRRVDGTPRFSVPLSPCGECLSLIHYSKVHPLESDTALLRDTAKVLRKELSAPARLRYLLRRVFLPAVRRDYR